MLSSFHFSPIPRFLAFIALTWSAALGHARQLTLDVSLAQKVLKADEKQTTFLKVGLTGFELAGAKERAPVNISIVLDKSGSMAGDKIARAKEAAIQALDRLGPQDIVSVVTYDSDVSVIIPAMKLTDRQGAVTRIQQIEAAGSTALHAGVTEGAKELRKFLDKNRVNRVILLSDGLANVGPQTPSELGELGATLAKEGISVTTIGLGLDYNEDLMTQLARKSDANHIFVEKSSDLVSVFNREFNDVLSVVAQELTINIHCQDSIRPIRLLNGEGEFSGQDVLVKMNQLYSKQEKYVILEVEVPAHKAGDQLPLADVTVTYANMDTKTTDRLASSIGVTFSQVLADVENSRNSNVLEQCVSQLANLENMRATELRDAGNVAESRALLEKNAEFLDSYADKLASPALRAKANDNRDQSRAVESAEDWKRNRKQMRFYQYREATQQLP